MEDRKQKIDEWLDSGLKHYTNAEPRQGLESRLVATLRAETQHCSLGAWTMGLAMAVVVAVSATLLLVRRPVLESSRPTGQPSALPNKSPVRPQSRSGSAVTAKSVLRHPTFLRAVPGEQKVGGEYPRIDQFPSPRPLNKQEELLVHYLQQRRQEAVKVARAQAELETNKFLASVQALQMVRSLPTPQYYVEF